MLARYEQIKKEQLEKICEYQFKKEQSDFVQCYSVGPTKPENSKYIIET